MTIDDVKLSEEGRFLPWGKVAAEKLQKVEDWIASGGGNPNRVEVVTGTLANPFTGWTKAKYAEFLDAYYDGNASASMVIDATGIGYAEASVVLFPFYNEPFFMYVYIEAEGDVTALYTSYIGNFETTPLLNEAKAYTTEGGVIDLEEYASILPTTLTIIWHPLPESE